MVAVGDADLAVGARRAFVRDQERDDARQSAWNATVIMSVISLKCSAKSAGMP